VPEGASIAEIAPAAARRRRLGGGAARREGSFSVGLFRACLDRCRALELEPKF
jgi:hypothetical protein